MIIIIFNSNFYSINILKKIIKKPFTNVNNSAIIFFVAVMQYISRGGAVW